MLLKYKKRIHIMTNNKGEGKRKSVSELDSTRKKNNEPFRKKQLKIIKKATKLFTQKGYAQSSMREISKVTNIDISNLYYFIKSKEEILFLAFDMIHSPAADLFEKHGIFNIENPEEQLRTAIRRLTEINYDYRNEILLLYRESKVLPKNFLKIILSRESRLVSHFEEILKNGVEMKLFNIEDTSYAANMIVYLSSIYPLRRWNLKTYTKEELLDLTEKTILKTIMV
jgi:TetR/AcrR family transcriptional regulator, cholesterol catabolism regulator